jgi:hypothetical protein
MAAVAPLKKDNLPFVCERSPVPHYEALAEVTREVERERSPR